MKDVELMELDWRDDNDDFNYFPSYKEMSVHVSEHIFQKEINKSFWEHIIQTYTNRCYISFITIYNMKISWCCHSQGKLTMSFYYNRGYTLRIVYEIFT
jgi:hypothetical protein